MKRPSNSLDALGLASLIGLPLGMPVLLTLVGAIGCALGFW